MATVKCPLGQRGKASREWHDGEKYRIYCEGWIDPMTEEYLDACKNCSDHVNKAQADLDKWNEDRIQKGVDLAGEPDVAAKILMGYCGMCDRVKVVRCKDCAHRGNTSFAREGYIYCKMHRSYLQAEGFCSEGVKNDQN